MQSNSVTSQSIYSPSYSIMHCCERQSETANDLSTMISRPTLSMQDPSHDCRAGLSAFAVSMLLTRCRCKQKQMYGAD